MKSTKSILSQHGRFNVVGSRKCDDCGSDVPIIERTDLEGNTHQESICLKCDTQKIRETFPAAEEMNSETKLKRKVDGFSRKYEKVPPDLEGKTFDDFKAETDSEKEAFRLAKEYAENFKKLEYHSLIFRGDMGLGKSLLGNCIKDRLRELGYTAMFLKTKDYLSLIKSTYDDRSPISEETIFKMLANIDFLVLDEVGGEYIKKDKYEYESWASDQLYELVDSRASLPTFYTMNYSSKDLLGKYGHVQGKRILSRIQSGAKAHIIEGRDRRIEKF